MNFGLLIIGDEILSGKREDQHLPKLIELLAERGLQLTWARCVGDEPARITAALCEVFATGDAVFSCGGIGATPDDHTRQCAAAALGRPLVLHPEAKALIIERMRELAAEQGEPFEPEREENRHRLHLGMFPEGARIIPNPYNKIAGFSCDGPAGGTVHFVPGFPVMAWPMMAWVLDTQYGALHGEGRLAERSVIVYGALEPVLTPLMHAIEARFVGVKVFSLPSVDHPEHGRHIELGVKGMSTELDAAYAMLLEGLRVHDARLGPEMVR